MPADPSHRVPEEGEGLVKDIGSDQSCPGVRLSDGRRRSKREGGKLCRYRFEHFAHTVRRNSVATNDQSPATKFRSPDEVFEREVAFSSASRNSQGTAENPRTFPGCEA